MTMLFFYLTLSLGVSFLCSLFEAVILSVSPGYASSLVKEEKRGGKLLARLKDNIDDSLAAILTLNTISHTIGAAGVGAEVLKNFGDNAVAIGSTILTLLILVLSEIIPKTIGASYWRTFAIPVAQGIRVMIWLTYPFVVSFKFLSKFIGSSHAQKITRTELAHTMELGHDQGALTEKEVSVVKNMFHLRHMKTAEIMTPRTVVFALSADMTIEDAMEDHVQMKFSRIPIYEGDIDHLMGMVVRYELLESYAREEGHKTLKDISHSIHAVPPTLPVSDLLEKFIARNSHMFAVVDEHGGTSGVVTLEDTVETLLGSEIVDETDEVEDMRELAKEKWENRKQELKKDDEKTDPESEEATLGETKG